MRHLLGAGVSVTFLPAVRVAVCAQYDTVPQFQRRIMHTLAASQQYRAKERLASKMTCAAGVTAGGRSKIQKIEFCPKLPLTGCVDDPR